MISFATESEKIYYQSCFACYFGFIKIEEINAKLGQIAFMSQRFDIPT
jgi:hypothetical protein